MNMFFGSKLKELRIEKGLTQEQLAKFFNVSKTTICQWETKKQEPSLEDLVNIAIFFDVTSDYLIGLETEDTAKYVNSFNNFNNSGNIHIK